MSSCSSSRDPDDRCPMLVCSTVAVARDHGTLQVADRHCSCKSSPHRLSVLLPQGRVDPSKIDHLPSSICRRFARGQCKSKVCTFSHDLSEVVREAAARIQELHYDIGHVAIVRLRKPMPSCGPLMLRTS